MVAIHSGQWSKNLECVRPSDILVDGLLRCGSPRAAPTCISQLVKVVVNYDLSDTWLQTVGYFGTKEESLASDWDDVNQVCADVVNGSMWVVPKQEWLTSRSWQSLQSKKTMERSVEMYVG